MDLEKMKKVSEIFQLCIEINDFENRQRSITGSKPTVFLNFSGHVAALDIQVFEGGWEEQKEGNKKFCIYLDNYFKNLTGFAEEAIKQEHEIKAELDSCIQYLKYIKEGSCERLQQVI